MNRIRQKQNQNSSNVQNKISLIQLNLKRLFIMSQIKQQIDQIFKIQNLLLGKRLSLCELFQKFCETPLFVIPQNSIVVNLDNITFGPEKYSVRILSIKDAFLRVIYFTILYYIFEINSKQCGENTYTKLLHFIIKKITKKNYTIDNRIIRFQELQIYLIKFFNILLGRKNENRMVVEQLRRLPQIDHILLILIKEISRNQCFQIDKNAKEFQQYFLQNLDLKFQFLSNELILFQNIYKIEIRHYAQDCQFFISKESLQTIQSIRQEYLLSKQSAFFQNSSIINEKIQVKRNKQKDSKIIRKSTIKSIGSVQNEIDIEKQNISFKKINESEFIQDFNMILSLETFNTDYDESQRLKSQPKTSIKNEQFPSQNNQNKLFNSQQKTSIDLSTKKTEKLNYEKRYTNEKKFDLRFVDNKTKVKPFSYGSYIGAQIFQSQKIVRSSKSTHDLTTIIQKNLKQKKKSVKQIKIPAFIKNRQKHLTQIYHNQLNLIQIQKQFTPLLSQKINSLRPKITFTYKNK